MANIGSIYWSDQFLRFDFGEGHIYRNTKYKLFINKIRQLQDQYNYTITEINQGIDIDAIEQEVKQPHFERLVKLSETGEGYIDEGSTPAIKGLLEIIQYYCQGTYLGIKDLFDRKYSYGFNCLGGRHHAGPNKSGGSSYINDLGVAIPKLRQEGYDKKIAIIDLDYHPHDGTLQHFGDDGSVFTASIHDQGWGSDPTNTGWGDGFGTSFEIDITEDTSGEQYIELLTDELLPKVDEFDPELIVYINGVDGHKEDNVSSKYPHRHFALEDEDYRNCAEVLATYAKNNCGGKILGLGAGGYTAKTTSGVWVDTVITFDDILS